MQPNQRNEDGSSLGNGLASSQPGIRMSPDSGILATNEIQHNNLGFNEESADATASSSSTLSQSSESTQATADSSTEREVTVSSTVTVSSQDEDMDTIDAEEIASSTENAQERAWILRDLIDCRRNYRQINDGSYYDVAAITNHYVRSDGSRWYKIRWEGYGPDSDSWVRSSDLNCPRKLAHYFYLRRLCEVLPLDLSDSSDTND